MYIINPEERRQTIFVPVYVHLINRKKLMTLYFLESPEGNWNLLFEPPAEKQGLC